MVLQIIRSKHQLYLKLAMLVLIIAGSAFARQNSKPNAIPDVIVMVMSGISDNDLVSINYNSKVSEKQVKKDLATIAQISAWSMGKADIKTIASDVSNIPTTSASFEAPAIIYKDKGYLPIEPFIIALKKYKLIEINYIVVNDFKFNGLKNFRNEYVDIQMSRGSNSYKYQVNVLNNNFKQLGLSLSEIQQKPDKNSSSSSFTKLFIVLCIAIIASLLAYIIVNQILQRRIKGER